MTFQTWWNEHGSLHPSIFNLPYIERERFCVVAKAAWEFQEEELKKMELDNEKQMGDYENRLDEKQEKIDDLREKMQDVYDSLEDIKEAIYSRL